MGAADHWNSARRDADSLLDGNWDLVFRLRAYVEQLQEMFVARKADLVADDHWRAMHWLVRSFFAPEIDRTIFEGFVEMGWVTPEFAKFGREFVVSGIWKDPLGRLEPIEGSSLTSRHRVSSSLAIFKTHHARLPFPPTKISPCNWIARIRSAPFAIGFTFRSAPMDKPLIYFVGNSLGLMPKATRQIVDQELDDWAKLARRRTLRRGDALVFLSRDPARTGGAAGRRAA